MAVVKVKNSNTTSSTPSSLARGELAVNLQDKLIWVGNAAAGITALTGTIAIQNANSVTLTGGTINGIVIGGTTAAAGSFTTLDSTSTATLQDLQVNGTATFTTDTSIQASLYVDSDVAVYGSGRLIAFDSDNSNYVGFTAPAVVSANKVWVLPAADGSPNSYLKTNGSGTLSWDTPGGGGSPGGSNTQVQFNNSGSFGGSANLTWDGTNLSIGAGGDLKLYNSGSTASVNLQAPGSLAADKTFTLPDSHAVAGQFLAADESGNMSWQACPGADLYLFNLGIV